MIWWFALCVSSMVSYTLAVTVGLVGAGVIIVLAIVGGFCGLFGSGACGGGVLRWLDLVRLGVDGLIRVWGGLVVVVRVSGCLWFIDCGGLVPLAGWLLVGLWCLGGC